jgi:anti-sigma factor RsiW
MEQSWRRKLSPEEETELRGWLAAHPETQADWEAELGLNEALDAMPDVPVPTNFTANVLQAVERETATLERKDAARSWQWRLSWWLPRTALAGLVTGLALFSYFHGQAVRRAEMRNSVVAVNAVKSLPSPDILENFEAIRAMDQTPPADEQLLTLLQ